MHSHSLDDSVLRPVMRRMRAAFVALIAAGAAALTACGGGGGSMAGGGGGGGDPGVQACTGSCGSAVLTLTDAPGDFISYTVNVVSLQLQRADGTVVETLPVKTQVNFAQLVNLSEIVSAVQVPAGSYVSAKITLDYGGATIVVDNGTTGVTIAPDQIIDGDTGKALLAPNPTQLTLTLSLASGRPLVITPGKIAHLALDFNLAVSNAVTPSATSPTTVTVTPVLSGSLVPDTSKEIRVRGPLVSIGTDSFVIDIRPFDDDQGDGGQLTVNTTANTTFTVNGVTSTGSQGLTALAGVPTGTVVAAFGTWDIATQTFTASTVAAGSSVPGTGLDSVEGAVLSRSGNTLVVGNGEMLYADHQDLNFVRQVTVTVADATAVSERGQSGTFTIADISVGQHAQFAGKLGTDGSGNITLDATAGSAQLLPTSLAGTVVSVADNVVTVNLKALDGRSPAMFNFAGTGTSGAEDAVATAYTVGLPAALSPTSVSAGAPVRFTGFVTAFGAAGGNSPPDFTATSLVSYASTEGHLELRWPAPGDASAFASIAAGGLTINQTAVAAASDRMLLNGFVSIDPATIQGGIEILPYPAATNPLYAIAHGSSWSVDTFASFGDFAAALQAALTGTTAVLGVDATGSYSIPVDPGSPAAINAERVIVVLNN